jgi:hypothetical protein
MVASAGFVDVKFFTVFIAVGSWKECILSVVTGKSVES